MQIAGGYMRSKGGVILLENASMYETETEDENHNTVSVVRQTDGQRARQLLTRICQVLFSSCS